MTSVMDGDSIKELIVVVRNQRVMLDTDLARLYGVEVRQLKRQVRRNGLRFPADFMFELTRSEYASLRCQLGTLKKRGAHSKYPPYAFTEHGVAMLSSVLNSPRAIEVNIAIIRVFVRLRRLPSSRNVFVKLGEIERRLDGHDAELGEQAKKIRTLFELILQLLEPPARPQKKIGFRSGEEKAADS